MSIKIYVKYVKNNRGFHTTKLNLPTGNLDSRNSHEIMGLLKESNKAYDQTLIMITHDESIALQADRIIAIEDGRITRDEVIRS